MLFVIFSACGVENPEVELVDDPKPVLSLMFDSEAITSAERQLISNSLTQLVDKQEGSSSRCIQINYIGYEQGSRRIVEDIALPELLEEATLNFEVKFDYDFKFVKGGNSIQSNG
ncbi:MAG: hypothetical protein JXQ96_01580 [Cyclobacteriaceae bacterium]